MLSAYEDRTGVVAHFNAHLSHPAQFTPESIAAILRIRKHGFMINTQIPLQESVNIFRDDYEKTISILTALAELQGKNGIRPYKYILHMNSGSLDYSVPLEYMLRVLGELKYCADHPLPETWQPVSMSILCREGNILLSPQLVFGMKKKIFPKQGYVEYEIPVPDQNTFRYISYREPIMKGFNDLPTWSITSALKKLWPIRRCLFFNSKN